ncbi:unnamed protein product [Soboliphyme baturini]|uniref:Uncharacterized protein n=1 Tax=Soboliphyme baturini TaxID=241478 RepID=A0A183J2Z5_9BILA|nr:unnamed protein product [Soboliphyme baturini]
MIIDVALVLLVMSLVYYVILFLLYQFALYSVTVGYRLCQQTAPEELKKMLGAAFNARYMSIQQPADISMFKPVFGDVDFDSADGEGRLFSDGVLSTNAADVPFSVDPNYRQVLPHDVNSNELLDFAVTYSAQKNASRRKAANSKDRNQRRRRHKPVNQRVRRSASPTSLPWSCETTVQWMDLGADHFPRYLRSVRCTSDRCFYGHYRCQPKAFTVKVLKRLMDKCIEITPELVRKFMPATAAEIQNGMSPSSVCNDPATNNAMHERDMACSKWPTIHGRVPTI